MKKLIPFLIVFSIFISVESAFASDGKEDKIINKHKEMIENAAPDDWHILAKCADICLKKNINRKEVASWIDQSLDIKETPYNLEVKGDYYRINNLPKKAGEYYLKAIKSGTEEDPDFDSSALQEKIAEVLELDINS